MNHTRKQAMDNIDPQSKLTSLLTATRAVLSLGSFETVAKHIFDEACNITGAQSGYVALLSPEGDENEVLFLEAGGHPCTVDENLPMPIRGLREQAYRTNKTVYDNDFMNSEWIKFMPAGHVVLRNVMFSPLVIDDATVGIMGLANKDGDFTDADAEMATAYGELAAIALANSRYRDKLEATNTKLTKTLNEVKTLQGLIPICAECKQIRDDNGYWSRIEQYLSERTDAQFSHGICPDCLKKYYDND